MGCNCKNVEKLEKVNLFTVKNNKIGIFNRLNAILINSLNKTIVVLLFILLTPIVILALIFNYLFKGTLMLVLPKFMAKYLKKIKKDE
jgi:hypothetical protein